MFSLPYTRRYFLLDSVTRHCGCAGLNRISLERLAGYIEPIAKTKMGLFEKIASCQYLLAIFWVAKQDIDWKIREIALFLSHLEEIEIVGEVIAGRTHANFADVRLEVLENWTKAFYNQLQIVDNGGAFIEWAKKFNVVNEYTRRDIYGLLRESRRKLLIMGIFFNYCCCHLKPADVENVSHYITQLLPADGGTDGLLDYLDLIGRLTTVIIPPPLKTMARPLQLPWKHPPSEESENCKIYRISAEMGMNLVGRENLEFNQAAAQFAKLLPTVNISQVREIHYIEYSEQHPVLKNYAETKIRFQELGKSSDEIMVFHGTGTEENFSSIVTAGFLVGGKGQVACT